MSRIVLAMSGGVDSSVAAKLLLDQGHEVIGVFMRHGSEPTECAVNDETLLPVLSMNQSDPGGRTDHKQGCCTARDAEDARRVADRLQIPFYALNLSNDFGRIIDYFVEEYAVGRTPNPCIMCNNWIKFGRLFKYADSVDAEFVATGHYAQLESRDSPEPLALLRGFDDGKDQSYVLFGIEREYLRRMMLPLGGYQKDAIRALAADVGLRVAEKKDSQEICFVTSGKHAEFVADRIGGATAGEIVTTSGEVVGEHAGIEGYTIGQRRGLGVAMGEPYFVVQIKAGENQIVIGKHEELGCLELTVNRTNWLVPAPREQRCLVQIRYNSKPANALIRFDAAEDTLTVRFEKPCFGVAPGQAAVCYQGNRVLGGGWIESTSTE